MRKKVFLRACLHGDGVTHQLSFFQPQVCTIGEVIHRGDLLGKPPSQGCILPYKHLKEGYLPPHPWGLSHKLLVDLTSTKRNLIIAANEG